MASTTIVLYESNPRVLSLIVVFCADTDVDSCRRMHFAVGKDASHNYYVSYIVYEHCVYPLSTDWT